MKKFNRIMDAGQKIYLLLPFLLAIGIFTITLVRAGCTAITYDEACTYLTYVQDIDYGKFESWKFMYNDLANNHWLNTLLIYFVQSFSNIPYDEFLIRLPNVIFFAIYLVTACYLFYKKKISLFAYIMLIFNYYLDEYFGLARGYGMAACLVLLALAEYEEWRLSNYSKNSYLTKCGYFLVLAASANTISLLLFPAIFLLAICHLHGNKALKIYSVHNIVHLCVQLILTVVLVIYHFNVSGVEDPLYTAVNGTFVGSVISGYLGMFYIKGIAATILEWLIVVQIIVTAIILYKGKKLLKQDYFIMLIMYIIISISMQGLFHKGYAIGRVLLPAYPMVVFAFVQIVRRDFLYIRLHHNIKVGMKAIGIICLCLSFRAQLNLHSTTDYADNYVIRDNVYQVRLSGINTGVETYPDYDSYTPIYNFYRDQLNYYLINY